VRENQSCIAVDAAHRRDVVRHENAYTTVEERRFQRRVGRSERIRASAPVVVFLANAPQPALAIRQETKTASAAAPAQRPKPFVTTQRHH
jgi:hypothetical protein